MPFSTDEIKRYLDFFNFSQSISMACGESPVAKAIIISVIIANFCAA
jgi:hypothetical protein